MKWRNLLFTTEGLGDYVSGAILFDETLFQKDPSGKPFVDVLNDAGVIPGIKVDKVKLPTELLLVLQIFLLHIDQEDAVRAGTVLVHV